jgi:hypothetical protein
MLAGLGLMGNTPLKDLLGAEAGRGPEPIRIVGAGVKDRDSRIAK